VTLRTPPIAASSSSSSKNVSTEEVDAAAFEDSGLLGEDLRALGGGDAAAGLAEGPDRAGDEDVAARDLPCFARELDGAAVDRM